MGNQECSVKQAPCFEGQCPTKAPPLAAESLMEEPEEKTAPSEVPLTTLRVEEASRPSRSSRPEPRKAVEEPEALKQRLSGGSAGEAVDWSKLPDTYFECEAGESPALEDETEPQHFRFEFESGAIYDGQWLQGARHGIGKQMWPDGTEYVGQWRTGRAHGLGRIKHSDGDSYCGEWRHGRAHGCGVYRFQEGAACYEGQFRCDQREGLGVESWVDGSCFAGGFRQGQKSGFGSNTWPDGTVYHGTWRANCPSGPGEYALNGGTNFKGQWEKSAPHGIGRYEWPDGRTYCGKYNFDKKEGFGILTEADGTERHGFWLNGELQ